MREVSCTYELDDAFRIVRVDDGWSRFAIENGAPELLPPAPIGRSVFSYIADRTTAMLYERLFQRVLATDTPARIPIRCDAPALRRFLEIEVAPLPSPGLCLTTTIVRTEPRAPVPLLLDSAAADALRMCTFCKRVETDAVWAEVETFVSHRRIFEDPAPAAVTHAVCDDCTRLMDPHL